MNSFNKAKRYLYLLKVLFIFTSISVILAQEPSFFPQDKVDKVCLDNRRKKVGLNTQRDRAQKPLFPEKRGKRVNMGRGFFKDEITFSGSEDLNFMSDKEGTLYIGPGPDTFFVDTDYVQDGDIIIFGEGVLLVENAKLTLSGCLYQQDRGQAIFRNGAYLHVDQQYCSQYPQILRDSARFEATDATVYANTVYRTFLHGSSEYIARRTHFPFWNFRQLYDNSRLIMEDANMVGDLTINDSCQVSFVRCDTILPWFGVGEGDFVDIQFPDYEIVDHFKFDTSHPGIEGINYTVTFDTCRMVVCGIESWPGGTVTVRNSVCYATPRILGSDTVYFNNITNQTFYPFLSLPLADRSFQIVNSYVQLWCIYTYDDAVLYMDSCIWGESHAKDNSSIHATHSTAKGFPSSVTSTHNGFFSFTDGECLTFVSAWDRATTLLINAHVAPDQPGVAQATNLAHGHSNLLAVNSYFEYEPEALDTALVMVVAIDSISTAMVDTTITIFGSAWIDAGPFNLITFDGYKLYWAHEGDSIWILIEESMNQVYNDSIATWNTSGMDEGEYVLRLTVWDSAGDSLTAYSDVFELRVSSRKGDVNFDGAVNVLDVVMTVNFVLGLAEPTEAQFTAADMNNDGIVNVLDVIQTVNLILSQ